MSAPNNPAKSAIILEIGDLRTDGRCRNIAESLQRFGFSVKFIGPGEKEDETEEYGGIRIERLSVLKRLGFKVMFFHYWLRAFWRGVNGKPLLIVAEDLYSLPAAVAIKFFTHAKLLYDSKELYFAIASLQERPVTQRFWSAVERFCIKYADAVITSGERDSDVIAERYNIRRPVTINNHPPLRSQPGNKNILRSTYNIPDSYSIFLYQGWLMRGRGLFLLIDIAAAIDSVYVVITGDGVIRKELENYAAEKNVISRILFTGAVQYEELLEYTAGADVGCAIIEDYGMSYRHARPNKMFEYIQANIPVLASNMPAMEEVIKEWEVGIAVDPADHAAVVNAAKRLVDDTDFYSSCVDNCRKAAKVFHWGQEEEKIFELLDSMIQVK